MASKFMAFEGMVGTSSAWDDDYNRLDENTDESTEMNSMQYPNYQSNQNNGHTTIGPSPYGAVGDENNLNENLDEKCDKSVGYRKFIHRNSEQFKSICGGLLLLMGCGIHIVWGIFRVFNWYRCDNDSGFYLRLVIWSWYIGAIIGSYAAGFIVTKLRKRQIYLIGGVLLLFSGMLIALSDKPDPNIFILMSRLTGGFTQGLTYVVVVVHASENATKEFREFLMLIVGAVMNYSILISVLAFFHTERLMSLSLLNGLSLFMFGVCSMVITSKHATETIPFILQNNGSEMDALQTMGKLKKLPIAAQSVHHEFLVLKNLVQDEMDHYGMPTFRKILLPENRKSLIFCCYSRLCSVLSLNLPLIVMIMLFLRGWVDETATHNGVVVPNYCYSEPIYNNITTTEFKPISQVSSQESSKERPKRDTNESSNEKEKSPQESSSKKETDDSKSPGKINDKPAESAELIKDEDQQKQDKENPMIPNKPDGETKGKAKEKLKTTEKEENEQRNVGTKYDAKQKHQSDKEKTPIAKNEKPSTNQNEKPTEKSSEEKSSSDRTSNHSKNKPDKESEGNLEKDKKEPQSESNASPDAVVGLTFIGHLITFIHSRELTLILLAWFVFGTLTAAILYALNLRRFIYYAACVLSSALVLTGLVHSFYSFAGILHFCLIVYFNYVTIPIDLFSHCILAEAFPITLKAYSVAGVVIVENIVHIIIIGLYMTKWFHDSIILLMCIVAFISHEIARNLPQRTDLSLAEAREQYQHIDLMLFNEPKITNNQQQEFI